jgi:hypothetical protein
MAGRGVRPSSTESAAFSRIGTSRERLQRVCAENVDSMTARRGKQTAASLFDFVTTVGLGLPGVEAATKYDGSPMLKVGGSFMAGLATHRSAEPGTLVVRYDLEARTSLLEDAPDTYYVTDYYQPYPVVLVRLSHIDRDALRDLLSVSRQLTLPKARQGARVKSSPAFR